MSKSEPKPEGNRYMRRVLAKLWKKFGVKFTSNDACWEEIFRWTNPSCPRCGDNTCVVREGRQARCRSCRVLFSFTIGTMFHRLRRPKIWLFVIYLIQSAIEFNCHVLFDVVGCAYATCFDIFHKVSFVLQSLKRNTIDVPSRSLIGLFAKRSRCSKPNQPPCADEPDPAEEMEPINELADGHLEQVSMDSELEQTVLNEISTQPIAADVLAQSLNIDVGKLNATLTLLELNGLVVRLPGDRYVLAANKRRGPPAMSDEVFAASWEVVHFVSQLFGGISRRCLDSYLAMHWAYVDRSFWEETSLLSVCVRHPTVSRKQLLAQNTPLTVTVAV